MVPGNLWLETSELLATRNAELLAAECALRNGWRV
jgi:hypothetical protein